MEGLPCLSWPEIGRSHWIFIILSQWQFFWQDSHQHPARATAIATQKNEPPNEDSLHLVRNEVELIRSDLVHRPNASGDFDQRLHVGGRSQVEGEESAAQATEDETAGELAPALFGEQFLGRIRSGHGAFSR